MSQNEFVMVRRISKNNNAKIVTIPAEWYKFIKAKYGREPQYVIVRIDGTRLIIEPTFDEKLIQSMAYRTKRRLF